MHISTSVSDFTLIGFRCRGFRYRNEFIIRGIRAILFRAQF